MFWKGSYLVYLCLTCPHDANNSFLIGFNKTQESYIDRILRKRSSHKPKVTTQADQGKRAKAKLNKSVEEDGKFTPWWHALNRIPVFFPENLT